MSEFRTQTEELHEYLKSHDGVTQMSALRNLGIMRLASRISDLRKQGVGIKKEMVKVRARNGRVAMVARYSLEEIAHD